MPSCLGQTGAQTLSRVVAGESGGGFVSDDSSQGQGRRRRLELLRGQAGCISRGPGQPRPLSGEEPRVVGLSLQEASIPEDR